MLKRIAVALALICGAAVAQMIGSTAEAATRSEQTYSYGTADLTAYWYPLASGTRPVVILVHGGYWIEGSRLDVQTQARYVADQGYQVFSLDYRLGERWTGQRDDIATAYAWIKARAAEFDANPAKVVLIGESAGGQLVTNLATYGRGRVKFQGVVALSPVADPAMAYADGGKPTASNPQIKLRNAALRIAGGCTPTACPGTWTSMASKTNAGDWDPPMLLIASAGEWVPSTHSSDLCTALKAHGVPCTLKIYSGSGHAMANWNAAQPSIMAFLKERTSQGLDGRSRP
jgi:acetyl esterase/lipase